MKQLDAWTRQAAHILTTDQRPYFAPAQQILDVHQRQLDEAKEEIGTRLTVLILGATPELADMALVNGCRVLRVDCNTAMFEAAQYRQTVSGRSNETLIVGDWFDLHMIRKGEVDLVLGDSSFNHIPHASMPEMIEEMARITHADSRFSLKQIVLPDTEVEDYAFHNAVAAYRAGKVNANEFHKILRFYSFLAEGYDSASRLLDGEKVFRAIQEKHAAGELTDAEFSFLHARYNTIRHTVYRQSVQARLLARLGDCRMVQAGAECFYKDIYNVFVIRKR